MIHNKRPLQAPMNPNCHRCIHYFVTWEVNNPHGCRAMGFKSQRLPMIEVRRAMQGNNCLAFEPKKGYPSKFSKAYN
jgi:hypothetical protein